MFQKNDVLLGNSYHINLFDLPKLHKAKNLSVKFFVIPSENESFEAVFHLKLRTVNISASFSHLVFTEL